MQNNCVILHPCLPTDYFWTGSFRTYPYPPPRRVRANSEGGVSKRMQFPGELGVVVSWGLFPGALSKTGKLLKTNSCSVEQAGSYFTVNGPLKQELLFWLMMFFIKGRLNVFSSSYSYGTPTPTCICYSWDSSEYAQYNYYPQRISQPASNHYFFNTKPHRIEFVVVSLNIDLLQ